MNAEVGTANPCWAIEERFRAKASGGQQPTLKDEGWGTRKTFSPQNLLAGVTCRTVWRRFKEAS